ncbi:MAG: DNA repair protein RecO [Rubrivivax sp.]|nr:DNA repair protein RecO [Rubrivivax sp.]
MKRAAGPAPGRAPAGATTLGDASGGRGASGKLLSAYVLHQYDWSESSLILELFTRERGRLAVAAKGAKRPYSQLRGVLLPFQRLQVAFGRSSEDAEVHTLRSAEWAGGAAMPGGSALFAGFYLNELLLRLLARQDPHPGLFDAYAQLLPLLATADEAGAQAVLRAFELVLLREIGLLPELDQVTLTLQPVRPDASYLLQPEAGVTPAAGGAAALTGAQLVALQAALQHGSVEALCAACAPARLALRGSLRAQLQYHLGSQLRTRQVMDGLRRLLDPRVPAR